MPKTSDGGFTYRGITIFPTLCKVYELILLRRLERFANEFFFLIFSSASKRVLVVLRPHSPSWKLLILILNVEAKFLAVFLTSVKDLTLFGQMDCFTSYLLSLASMEGFGLFWKIYMQMSMLRFFFWSSIRFVFNFSGYWARENFLPFM